MQIVEGVKDAQDRAAEHRAQVNLHLSTQAELAIKQRFLYSAEGYATQLVQFDVAIAAKDGTGTKGDIAIAIGILALGSSGQSQAENSSANRVRFSVPLVLPESRRG
jgi:uncharacterized protein YgbK (DUF1537 family)